MNRLPILLPAWLWRVLRRPVRSDLRFVGRLWLMTALIALAAFGLAATRAHALPLSPGDRIQVTVPDGEEFSGAFHLDVEGNLPVPLLGPVRLQGLEPREAAGEIAARLVAARLFRDDFVSVTVQVLEWAPLEVTVAGAVYAPGRVALGQRSAELGAPPVRPEAPGAERPRRYLHDALKAAGGIRPDADLTRVTVTRGEAGAVHDLRGYLDGAGVVDVPLAAGDRIDVPSTGREDPALMRPSALTPPGIKVFASNLVQPSFSNSNANAPSSGISLPYGSRLSQAVVAANCAGGAAATNASRSVYLVRTDRLTGRTFSWQARIGKLLSAGDSAGEDNPLLLEGDALFCGDSAVTNLREVFRALTDVLLPFNLGRRP